MYRPVVVLQYTESWQALFYCRLKVVSGPAVSDMNILLHLGHIKCHIYYIIIYKSSHSFRENKLFEISQKLKQNTIDFTFGSFLMFFESNAPRLARPGSTIKAKSVPEIEQCCFSFNLHSPTCRIECCFSTFFPLPFETIQHTDCFGTSLHTWYLHNIHSLPCYALIHFPIVKPEPRQKQA